MAAFAGSGSLPYPRFVVQRNPPSHTEIAARAMGLTAASMEVRAPGEIEPAFARLDRDRAILVVFSRVFTWTHRSRIIEFAEIHRIPGAYGSAGFARMGGLVGLGANSAELLRRAAILVDRIINGARPGDLPIEQPTTFELAINLKTAKALGLTIPPSVLLQANEVIE